MITTRLALVLNKVNSSFLANIPRLHDVVVEIEHCGIDLAGQPAFESGVPFFEDLGERDS